MKILHLANFYHKRSGGIKTYLDNKRKYFDSIGIPFRLVIPGKRDEVQDYENARIYKLSAPPAPINPLYQVIWDLVTVNNIIREEKPDFVEVNDKWTLALLSLIRRKAFGSKLPAIGFHHERLDENLQLYVSNPDALNLVYQAFIRLFSAAFDKIFCASRFTAEELVEVAPDKVSILTLGTDVELFTPEKRSIAFREKYVKPDEILLLFVGRLAREKNIALLPPMMELLSEKGIKAKLLVVGVGNDRTIITSCGRSDITYIGFISDREEMAGLMASSDCFVFPSIKEPFGLVPLEAMASGIPVVCSDRGGVLEYSDSNSVKSVFPTPENYANAVEELTQDSITELGRIARKHALNFSWNKTFEKQMDLYDNFLSNLG